MSVEVKPSKCDTGGKQQSVLVRSPGIVLKLPRAIGISFGRRDLGMIVAESGCYLCIGNKDLLPASRCIDTADLGGR